jgi:hypothetical protein
MVTPHGHTLCTYTRFALANGHGNTCRRKDHPHGRSQADRTSNKHPLHNTHTHTQHAATHPCSRTSVRARTMGDSGCHSPNCSRTAAGTAQRTASSRRWSAPPSPTQAQSPPTPAVGSCHPTALTRTHGGWGGWRREAAVVVGAVVAVLAGRACFTITHSPPGGRAPRSTPASAQGRDPPEKAQQTQQSTPLQVRQQHWETAARAPPPQ